MLPNEISTFLDATISARIALRLIAEQHIAISRALDDPVSELQHVGIVDMKCSPAEMIKMCTSYVSELCEATLGASPSITLEGTTDATFA
jgi:26S proteasome regulatory subunit T1